MLSLPLHPHAPQELSHRGAGVNVGSPGASVRVGTGVFVGWPGA